MHDTGTVLGGNEIAGNHAEGVAFGRLGIRKQLLIADSLKFTAFVAAADFKRDGFLTGFIICQFQLRILFGEIFPEKVFCKDYRDGQAGIGIEGFHLQVLNVFADGKGGIAGQGPGGGGPCQEEELSVNIAEQLFGLGVADYFKLCHNRIVLHVAVAAGLVQLVGAEARTGGRGEWLYGIALVKQAFFIKL